MADDKKDAPKKQEKNKDDAPAIKAKPLVEIFAGITTFLTMSYIVFLQPSVLSVDFAGKPTGLSFDAVMLATCLSAFVATMIMGLYAKYPIAQAPGMGENFFFVSVIMAIAGMKLSADQAQAIGASTVPHPDEVALGIVLIAGAIFMVLSLPFLGVREAIINAVSPCLKNGIAVGIGLFIAFIGLEKAGIIADHPATLVQLNPCLTRADIPVDVGIYVFAGILVATAVLHALRVPGSIFIGIVGGAAACLAINYHWPNAIPGMPKWPAADGGQIDWARQFIGLPNWKEHAFFKCDVVTVFKLIGTLWPYILIFLFMDMFDTVGTLIGVSEQAGLMKDGKLPRANRALLSDAVGTVAGALMGTSTVTSYIESAAGVEQGGRTGLTAVTAAICFVAALFFTPIVKLVGSYPPITTPALVIVGAMMMKNVAKIDWEDYSESIPCFLIILGIPLCFSIADGLAMGLIAYPIIKLLTGKVRGTSWLSYVVGAAFLARYIWLQV